MMVMIGLTIGSVLGGYIPILLGASFLSYWSIIGNAIGGIIGVWMGYKLSEI